MNFGEGSSEKWSVGVMVLMRGKLMVLGEEVDLRGQGGTIIVSLES